MAIVDNCYTLQDDASCSASLVSAVLVCSRLLAHFQRFPRASENHQKDLSARAVSISDRFFRPLRRHRSLSICALDAAVQIWDAKAYHSFGFASFAFAQRDWAGSLAAKDAICMRAPYLQSRREERTKRGIRFIRCTVISTERECTRV